MKRFLDFVTAGIWRVRLSELSRVRGFALKHLRMVLLAFRGFKEDKCQLRAAALTFFSLLSVVPVVAMAFGVAKGFNFEKKLEFVILDSLKGHEEIAASIIDFSTRMLNNTQGGLIAGIGVVILFWTVIKVLGNIEQSFNAIWGVKRSRSLSRKFTDYLAIMLICPFLFILSSSLTVYITGFISSTVAKLSIQGGIGALILRSLKLSPYLCIWLLFSFIYIVIPNTKVRFKSGIVGGIIAGTIYQLIQWVYITFQIGVTKFGAIYGSFAALPLFLVWLQMSWLIVLFGAEVAFAYQNDELYEFEPDCKNASFSFKRLVLLNVLSNIIKDFVKGNAPKNAQQLSSDLGMPIRLVRDVLFMMTECRLLSELTTDNEKTHCYQPAEAIERYTISYVLTKIAHHGIDTIPIKETPQLLKLKSSLAVINNILDSAPENLNLKDL